MKPILAQTSRDVPESGGAIAGSGNALSMVTDVSEITNMGDFLRAREILRAQIDEEQAKFTGHAVFDENQLKVTESAEALPPIDDYTLDWALNGALEHGTTDGPTCVTSDGRCLRGPSDADWAEIAYWVFTSPSAEQLAVWFAGKPKDVLFPWVVTCWPTESELVAVGL